MKTILVIFSAACVILLAFCVLQIRKTAGEYKIALEESIKGYNRDHQIKECKILFLQYSTFIVFFAMLPVVIYYLINNA